MRIPFRLLLVFILSIAGLPALAQSAAPSGLVDPNYQMPDLTGSVARLRQRFQALTERLQAMLAAETLEGVDARLEELFLPTKPGAFRSRYSLELRLAQKPDDLHSWQRLAERYLAAGRVDDAAAAASHVYLAGRRKPERAAALSTMAEARLGRGEVKATINLYKLALELERTSDRKRRFDSLIERYEIRVKDIAVDVEPARPVACIVFNQPLTRAIRQTPEDYVALVPPQDVDISARDNRICLRGLRRGTQLDVIVKAGVTGVNGGRLYGEVKRRFGLPDRAARISFDRGAYVLPRSSREQLSMTSVNLAKVKLALYRINDRNLAKAVLQGIIGQDLYPGSETQISQSTGVEVWRGEVAVKDRRNEEVVTLLPLAEMFGVRQAGIYALVARPPEAPKQRRWRRRATQWLVVSDLGLTSFQGRDGMHVIVRSLDDASAVSGAELTLTARNNSILATAVSDARGVVSFPAGSVRGRGGDRPALVVARHGRDDYNLLRLVGSQLDLSERGVGGRAAAGVADAYLYTERGVYRPGETVRLSVLLRNSAAEAMGGLPLTVKVVRPGGTEMYAKTVTGDALGGYGFDIPLSDGARAGTWNVSVYLDPKGAAIGGVGFQVEDFVPQRLAAELSSPKQQFRPGEAASIALSGRFFYGAPAGDLKVEARLTLAIDTEPFPAYAGYRFGLVQETYRPQRRELKATRTDAAGRARIEFDLAEVPDTSHPLRAEVRASVIDIGGRPVSTVLRRPIRVREVEVGVRPRRSGYLGSGDTSQFDLVALDAEGGTVAKRKLSYQWIREHHDYSWYQHGGRWQTRVIINDEVMAAGDVTLGADGKAVLERPLDNGRYRLEVADPDAGSAASYRFSVGWWRAAQLPDVPDALELSLKDDDLADGDGLKAFIRAPFAGTALIAVMSDRLHHLDTVALPEGGTEITVPVSGAWGPGAYLMVTAYRRDGKAPSLQPNRAMGLAWFSVDRRRREVAVEFEVPETALPRGPVTLPVRVTGADVPGGEVRLTVAAVDEGILRLTGYRSPDPRTHYLGQRRLAVVVRDLYGRLIRSLPGTIGRLRSGGDARIAASLENAEGPKTRTVKTVALYQRDITLDADGRGEVTLDLPDFNGRLRLMAVAYGRNVIGAGEAALVVRDPLVAEVLLPRFLAPGDHALATLSLQNLSGRPLDLQVRLDAREAIAVGDETLPRIQLADQARRDLLFRLSAKAVGEGRLDLTVSTPGMAPITRKWDIAVRPAWSRVTRRQVTELVPGQALAGAGLATDEFMAGTATTAVSVAARPDFDAPAMIESLLQYPYGCTEQVISRAMPLLYAADLSRIWGRRADDLTTHRNVDFAIQKILNRQRGDGAFSAWQSFGNRHPWLSAYVFDFLTRAAAEGFQVPRAAYAHAQAWLVRYAAQRGGRHLYAQAYALYALARVGAVKANEVRYFADANADRIRTRLGIGHLAAALAIVGERQRAERLFDAAIRKRRPTTGWIRDYGSDIRDGAALLTLLADPYNASGRTQLLAIVLERQFDRKEYFSTQERAWLLLATRALSSNAGMTITLDDRRIVSDGEPIRHELTAEEGAGVELRNLGQVPVRVIETRRGIPSVAPLPVQEGFIIKRSFFATDGAEVDLSAVRQNDQVVVLIEGQANLLNNHEALVVDLLPAGFEIENAAIGGEGGVGGFDFLPRLSPTVFQAARDDRFVAAMELSGRGRKFALAYLARAVTPGAFILPGTFVEDMYKPQYHGRGPTSTVTVAR